MSIDQDIANSSKTLEKDVRINHDITHGNDTTEVPTEGGPVPTIAKRLKDIETEWSQQADPLARELADTVEITNGYKTEAAVSASAAEASATEAAEELPKVQAEGDQQVNRVTATGDVQVSRVTAEGDTQTARAKSEADRSAQSASESESSNMQSAIRASHAESSAIDARDSAISADNSLVAVTNMQTDVTQKHDAVMAAYIPLATDLIRTQTVIIEHHAFQ